MINDHFYLTAVTGFRYRQFSRKIVKITVKTKCITCELLEQTTRQTIGLNTIVNFFLSHNDFEFFFSFFLSSIELLYVTQTPEDDMDFFFLFAIIKNNFL